jgi:hypothetical protein
MSHLYNIELTKEIKEVIFNISQRIPISLKLHKQVLLLFIKFEDGSDARINVWSGMAMKNRDFLRLYELLAY